MPKLKRQSQKMRDTSHLRRVRQVLGNESPEETSVRLERDAQRHAAALSKMSQAERSAHLQRDAERHAAALAKMSQAERSAYLQREAQRHTAALAKMSQAERSAHLQRDAQRHAAALAKMSQAERSAHLQRDAQRQNTTRAHASQAQTSARLEEDAARHRFKYARLALAIPIGTIPILDENKIPENDCGTLTTRCRYCDSKNFPKEKPLDGKFTVCCQKGKVQLPKIKLNETIQKLLTNEHELSKNFLDNIRSFNSSFAYASMGAQLKTPPGPGPYCFRVQGQIYHRAGPLHPADMEQRKFAQLYILDPEEAAAQRLGLHENSKCNPQLMEDLGTLFTQINPYSKAYKMLHEVEKESLHAAEIGGNRPSNVYMTIRQDRNSDVRRYNAPRVSEVAIVFKNDDGEPPLQRDLVVHLRPDPKNLAETRTKRMSVLDNNLDPMVYPIFYPYGDQSWGPNISIEGGRGGNRVTQMMYYGYQLAIRDEFNPFLSAGKLTQQYFVDAYIKTEANRLNWVRMNQGTLRTEQYDALIEHINSTADQRGSLPGIPVILPSSFQGSTRNMQQNYEDAMAIIKKYGKPDLFVTMTCNPSWKEIQENLESYQKLAHRPDLVARVFKLKLKDLLDDIQKNEIFGKCLAKVHVIEFQKRGLPHAHILIILSAEFKPYNTEMVDKLVCAEIPDITANPLLHAIVTKHMIHGPCGIHNLTSPCMQDGKCTKEFPKQFTDKTIANSNGYPKYQRRNNGVTCTVRGKQMDNRWIVPYNPYLSLKYNCHINVEVCASVKSVKYLFKYVYKGHDCAHVEIQETNTNQHNEIKSFVDSRYVSAPEAAWRLFGFNMHDKTHTIVRLAVHLPGKQAVTFFPTANQMATAAQRAEHKDTSLTAWFKLNAIPDSPSRRHLYTDIPNYYRLNKNVWTLRRDENSGKKAIGRMYSVAMSDPERYYLRLLLLHVPGATSFEYLRTVNGIEAPTFKDAAKLLGLLTDNSVWEHTLLECATFKMPSQIRQTFALICTEGEAADCFELWEKFKVEMCEDFVHKHIAHVEPCTHCENSALRDIRELITLQGKQYSNYNLPIPSGGYVISEEEYDVQEMEHFVDTNLPLLNEEQKSAFEQIIAAVDDPVARSHCFFIKGPGGSGKTFLYKLLLALLRASGRHVLATASIGIAANLLIGGRTYHSQFKLPVPVLNDSVSLMRCTSQDAASIKVAKLIIIDEATMATRHALSAIDRLLREIMQKEYVPFGGKVLLLGGDFRQTLPVIPRGNRSDIIEATIKFHSLWSEFKPLPLTKNQRSEDPEYSAWLTNLGDGKLPPIEGLPENYVEIPHHMLASGNSKESLVRDIFGQRLTLDMVEQFSSTAILCPKNEDVFDINERILETLEGKTKTYFSFDSIKDGTHEDNTYYPIEFLNDLRPSGMPPHKLNQKVGAIVMLLRNLNTKRGLCNGTRLLITALRPNLIIAKVLSGSAKGEVVFIPRIILRTPESGGELPFQMERKQFPVMLAFAMTINKSQGQTLDKVGIYLPQPVFAHGQLYVAFSRVRKSSDVRVLIIESGTQGRLLQGSDRLFTLNVVYLEVLQD